MPSLALTNYGVPLEIGQMLDFHLVGSVADYNGRLHLGPDGHLYWNGTIPSVPDAQKSVSYAASAGNANTLGGLPASSFYTSANMPVVVGTYTGNDAADRLINLGFTPKAVLVMEGGRYTFYGSSNLCGGLALIGKPVMISKYYQVPALSVDTYGFRVYYVRSSSGSSNTNNNGDVYHYIAFR